MERKVRGRKREEICIGGTPRWEEEARESSALNRGSGMREATGEGRERAGFIYVYVCHV